MTTNDNWPIRADMLGYGNLDNDFHANQTQSNEGAELAEYIRITKSYNPATISLLLNGQGFIPDIDKQRFNELYLKYGKGKEEPTGRIQSSDINEDDMGEWDWGLYSESRIHWMEEIKAREGNEKAFKVPDTMADEQEGSELVSIPHPTGKKSRLKREITLTYDGFKEISSMSQRQKVQVQEGNKGGYELMLHTLKTKIVPTLIDKYKDEFKRSTGQKIRDAVYLLEFIHAYKLGDPKANGQDESLKGWAFPKDELIIEQTGITKNELPKLKKILVDERLLVIKKRKPKGGSEKDFYVPFYFPYDDGLPL